MGFPQLFVALPWFTVDGYSFKQSVSWQPGVLGISSSTPGTSELPILWNSEIIKYQPLYTRIDTLSWWLVPLLFPFNLSLGNAVPFMFIPCHENPKKIAYITVSPINQGIIIPFYGYIMLYIYILYTIQILVHIRLYHDQLWSVNLIFNHWPTHCSNNGIQCAITAITGYGPKLCYHAFLTEKSDSCDLFSGASSPVAFSDTPFFLRQTQDTMLLVVLYIIIYIIVYITVHTYIYIYMNNYI